MAYVHCHNCAWSQDDFWHVENEKGYSPIHGDHFKCVQDWLEESLQDPSVRIHNFDVWWTKETGCGKYGRVEIRELIAYELEKRAKNIKDMHWMTYEDFKKDPNKVCPSCGSKNLDID